MVLISRLCRFIRLGMGFRVWGIGIILALGCTDDYERDNPTDPIHVYSVTFNGGEATGTPPAAITGSYNDIIQLPGQGNLEKSGYALAGWKGYGRLPDAPDVDMLEKKIESSSDEISYAVGYRYTITGNAVMNAVWIPSYTVTFDLNGATGTAPAVMKADSGTAIFITAPYGVEKSGYAFAGWNTNNSGTGTNYKSSDYYQFTGDITLYAVWISCSETNYYCDMRDGHIYKITTIGTQVWFAENLGGGTYGDSYDWTWAMGFQSNCENYSCSSQIQSPHQGVCPEGWHIPSNEDWNTLISYVESNSHCSDCAATKLKATSGWDSNGNGTDEYGFSALPGGFRGFYSWDKGTLYNVGEVGYWWSTNEVGPNKYGSAPYAHSYNMFSSSEFFGSDIVMKIEGRSVRCLQDNSSSSVPSSSSWGLSSSSSSSVRSSSSAVPPLSSGSVSSSGTRCTFNGNLTYCQYDTGCFLIDSQYTEPQGRTCFEHVSNCIEGGTLYIGVNETVVNNPPYGVGENCKTLGGTQAY